MITIFLVFFKKSPLLAFIKFEPTFLRGSLAVCLSAPIQGEAGGRGVWGEFHPEGLRPEWATRARQPFFGEISSRFEFSKAKSGLF